MPSSFLIDKLSIISKYIPYPMSINNEISFEIILPFDLRLLFDKLKKRNVNSPKKT